MKLYKALLLLLIIFICSCTVDQHEEIIIYIARGLKAPMEIIIKSFTDKYNVTVRPIYASSQSLVNAIKSANHGDLFIPGCSSYLKKLDGVIVKQHKLALHTPTIAVQKGNPLKVKSLHDLSAPQLRLALVSAKVSALGIATNALLEEISYEKKLFSDVELCSNFCQGLSLLKDDYVDATIVWETMINKCNSIFFDQIPIDEKFLIHSTIAIGFLSNSKNKSNALKFYNHIATNGPNIFHRHNYRAVNED
jgi:molybdate transport system substrate-binding protein